MLETKIRCDHCGRATEDPPNEPGWIQIYAENGVRSTVYIGMGALVGTTENRYPEGLDFCSPECIHSYFREILMAK